MSIWLARYKCDICPATEELHIETKPVGEEDDREPGPWMMPGAKVCSYLGCKGHQKLISKEEVKVV